MEDFLEEDITEYVTRRASWTAVTSAKQNPVLDLGQPEAPGGRYWLAAGME